MLNNNTNIINKTEYMTPPGYSILESPEYGREVKDILGFTEVYVILGNNKVEKVKMLVFKNAANSCLICRNVLATHPDTKHHFETLMGAKETNPPPKQMQI